MNTDLIRRLRLEPQPHQFLSLTRLYQHLIDERYEAADALEKLQGPLPEKLKATTTVECALVAEVGRLLKQLEEASTREQSLIRERDQALADLRHLTASTKPLR